MEAPFKNQNNIDVDTIHRKTTTRELSCLVKVFPNARISQACLDSLQSPIPNKQTTNKQTNLFCAFSVKCTHFTEIDF